MNRKGRIARRMGEEEKLNQIYVVDENGSVVEEPAKDAVSDVTAGAAPDPVPQNFDSAPQDSASAPQNFDSAPQNSASAPQNFDSAPQNFASAPQYTYEQAGNAGQSGSYSGYSGSHYENTNTAGSGYSTGTGYGTGSGYGAGSGYSGSTNYTGGGNYTGSGNYAGGGSGNYTSGGSHEYYQGGSYNPSGSGSGASGGNGNGGKGKAALAIVLALIFALCVGTGIWGVHHYLSGKEEITAESIQSGTDTDADNVIGENTEQPEDKAATADQQDQLAPDAEETAPADQQDQQAPGTEETAPAGQQDQQTPAGQQAQADATEEIGKEIIDEAGLIISNTETPDTELTKVVTKVMPSIVSVYNSYTETVQSFYGQTYTRQGEATGSGIIIGMTDSELLIVTNNHVVEGADGLKVLFVNQETAEADIKGTDANNDLAVIAVNLSNLNQETRDAIKVATLGDSDKIKIGEQAIAIGNALGYGQSVTTGIVSAKDREISDDEVAGTFIQTDAAINPGNSGGALVNINGDVIGINSSKIGGEAVEGMGFAIPISRALPIIKDLMSRETKSKVAEDQQGVIGISGASVTSDVARAYNMPKGVYVAQIIEGSGAASSELQEGDIITAIDGQSVSGMEDLQKQLQYYAAGTEVTLTVQRQDGTGNYVEKQVKVTLSTKDTIQSAENSDGNQNGSDQSGSDQGGQNRPGSQFDQEERSEDFSEGEGGNSFSFTFPFGF